MIIIGYGYALKPLTVFLDQRLALLVGQRPGIGPPPRAPADVPLPDAAQKGLWSVVVFRPELACFTTAHDLPFIRNSPSFVVKFPFPKKPGSKNYSANEHRLLTFYRRFSQGTIFYIHLKQLLARMAMEPPVVKKVFRPIK